MRAHISNFAKLKPMGGEKIVRKFSSDSGSSSDAQVSKNNSSSSSKSPPPQKSKKSGFFSKIKKKVRKGKKSDKIKSKKDPSSGSDDGSLDLDSYISNRSGSVNRVEKKQDLSLSFDEDDNGADISFEAKPKNTTTVVTEG
jgi:hypothetical protein